MPQVEKTSPPDFESIRDTLKDLPCTYYPALFRCLVAESHKAGTWAVGGCETFVRNAVLAECPDLAKPQ